MRTSRRKTYTIRLHGKYGDGKVTIVDKDIYEKYKDRNIIVSHGYAGICIERHFIGLHRLIMECPSGLVVDHKNHNRLDNRRTNLRVCTNKENARNRKGDRHYCWDNTHKYWRVEWKGTTRCYHSEDEARGAVKMIASGMVPGKRTKVNKYRPKYISRNRQAGYFFQCTIGGKRCRKYGFATIAEAVAYRDNFCKKKGVSLS